MKHFLLYGHGGAYNHGSEASVKCDIELIKKICPDCKITLSSHFPEQDREFHIPADEIIGRNMNGKTNEETYAETISRITPDTVCLSVGGDCYCYPNWQRYAAIHNAAVKIGAKDILWSCSLEPSMIDTEMLDVLRSYTMICARESVTYGSLKDLGLENVILTADIAFNLEPQVTDIPNGKYVVLNLSPLVIRKNPRVLTAYQALIDRIISDTNYNIALLPHVEVSVDNDFEALSQLNGDKDRLFRIPIGMSAAEYKYIISKSEACVAARTHVTIAAWSSLVPTIAVGYSAKARGIAGDLGQAHYVISNEDICEQSLYNSFFGLLDNKEEIHGILSGIVPKIAERSVCSEAISVMTQ